MNKHPHFHPDISINGGPAPLFKIWRPIALAVIFLLPIVSVAQITVTWNGSVDTDWDTPNNWDGNAVPLSAVKVLIPSWPTNQPVINASTMAVAQSLVIAQNATLVNKGTLSVSGAHFDAVTVNGLLDNQGTIMITAAVKIGVFISGTGSAVTNTGLIDIDNTENGVFNSNILDNSGDIKIHHTTSHGFVNAGPFTNNMNALVDVRNVGSFRGIDNYAEITNDGSIVLHTIAETGISCSGGSITNQSNGNIQITDAGVSSPHPGISNGTTIINEGSITITGARNYAVNNSGNFSNTGFITLNVNLAGTTGITNSGSFLNSNVITINNAGSFGIFHEGTLFENNGTITVNGTGSTDNAIQNQGAFNNLENGLIDINNAGQHGIRNAGGNADFTNEGIIDINGTGTGASNGDGIRNEKTFSNLYSIILKNTKENGIQNLPGQVFSNGASAQITIENTMSEGIANNGSFTAKNLSISGAGNFGIYNAASFTCNGTTTITNPHNAGVFNSGTFGNTSNLTVNSPGDLGFFQQGSSPQMNNSGTLTIETTTGNKDGIGLFNGAINNQGTISVNNAARWGIFVAANFNNSGSGSLLNINSSGSDGLHIDGASTVLANEGTINIGTTEGIVGGMGIYGNSGQVTNYGNVVLGKNIASTALNCPFSNMGQGTVKGSGTIAGNFSNDGGKISPGASPGVINFSGNYNQGTGSFYAEVFGLAGPGVAGGYDQIIVSGTATLGGVLDLVVSYGQTTGDEVTILSANSISGTFSTENVPNGWFILYDYPSAGQVTAKLGVLPVELVAFRAFAIDGKKVQLDWTTASETNNDYFSVERSGDGVRFEEIGQVRGKGTVSSGFIDYTFGDENPLPGNSYYRLRQVDFDGRFEFSWVVSVYMEGMAGVSSLHVFPNPSRGQVICEINDVNGMATLKLFDAAGKFVLAGELEGGRQPFDWGALPKGVYWMKVKADGKTITKKIVLRQ
ncbi:MAG: T9SS type A sorting domain-containing protein [Lewinellaceae bacterium]|nr:T9SS type A sorting domain-containing protein [Lewinellaceae bacterium]